MNLEKVLPPGAVSIDVDVGDKAAILEHVSAALGEAAGVDAADIKAALLAREALGSTGVGSGVALPHARLHVLRSTHAVFLRLAAPVDFDAIDEEPVDLVCALVASDEPSGALLEALAPMSRVLRDADRVKELRALGSAEEVRKALLGGG